MEFQWLKNSFKKPVSICFLESGDNCQPICQLYLKKWKKKCSKIPKQWKKMNVKLFENCTSNIECYPTTRTTND